MAVIDANWGYEPKPALRSAVPPAAAGTRKGYPETAGDQEVRRYVDSGEEV
jgi:hypothetical protein